jgi:WhiB family transcriptional regulator, redox-sensing transcriptional regulator
VSLASEGDDWRSRGACLRADPDLFFPLSSAAGCRPQVVAAKALCARCKVRQSCLEFALATRQIHGIWGGMTEEERNGLNQHHVRDRMQQPDRRRAREKEAFT